MTIPVDPLAPPGTPARAMPLRIRPLMLPGVALLAILLIGLASSLYTLVFKRGELPTQVSWSDLAQGETTVAIAHFLQQANPLEERLVTFDRVTSYLATGDLGARVRRGCGDWLFLTDELVLNPDRAANAAKHVKMVEQVAAYLKTRHIGLEVVPVPDKSRIEAAELCAIDRPAAIAPRLADVHGAWSRSVEEILAEATLERPRDVPYSWFGKRGEHSEHLGYILTDMQYLQRAHPGARW